jgi:hypothetical protein
MAKLDPSIHTGEEGGAQRLLDRDSTYWLVAAQQPVLFSSLALDAVCIYGHYCTFL